MQKNVTKQKAKGTPETTPLELSGQFFGDKHFLLLILLILIAAIVGALVAFSLKEATSEPQALQFPVTDDGRLFPPSPLTEQGLSQPELYQWAVEAVTNSYSFNFVNYKKVLLGVRGYYTDTGYRHYLKALTDSNTISAVVNNKFVVSAKPTSAPIVLKQGIIPEENVFYSQIKLPILVEFNSSDKQSTQNLVIIMTVKRVPEEQSEKGIAIAAFLAREGKS